MEAIENVERKEFEIRRIYLYILILAIVQLVIALCSLMSNLEIANAINTYGQHGGNITSTNSGFSINIPGAAPYSAAKIAFMTFVQNLKNGLGYVPLFMYAFMFIRLDNLKKMVADEDAAAIKTLRIGFIIYICFVVAVSTGYLPRIFMAAHMAFYIFLIIGLNKLIQAGTYANQGALNLMIAFSALSIFGLIVGFFALKPSSGYKAIVILSFLVTVTANILLLLAYFKGTKTQVESVAE